MNIHNKLSGHEIYEQIKNHSKNICHKLFFLYVRYFMFTFDKIEKNISSKSLFHEAAKTSPIYLFISNRI